jgi:hypothetical protein
MARIIDGNETNFSFEEVGGKGLGLLKLKSLETKLGAKNWFSDDNSVIVPDFFIIPYEIDLIKKRAEILDRAGKIGDKYAVRSSSCLEDIGENSFDGIFDTQLDVIPDKLLRSIYMVRKSAELEKAKSYSKEVGVELDGKMSVIVQKMVSEKDYTGVVYSRFPCPNDITKVIRDKSNYRYIDAFPRRKRRDGSIFINGCEPIVISKDYMWDSDNRQESLAELAVEIENEFKYPIILEFAALEPNSRADKFKINMLQARRLTKLSQSERFEMPELQTKGLIATTYDLNGVGDFIGESYVIAKYNNDGGYDSSGLNIFDKTHKEGYVLVAPYLQFFKSSLDKWTQNKKAVIAYTDLGDLHDMEISRKKNILYLNVKSSLGMVFYLSSINYDEKPPVKTGDRLRIVSDGEKGFVFKLDNI